MGQSKYRIILLVLLLIGLPVKADELIRTILLLTNKSSLEEVMSSKEPEVIKKDRFIRGYWVCEFSSAKLQYIYDNRYKLGKNKKGAKEVFADLKNKNSKSELKMKLIRKANEKLATLTKKNYVKQYKKCKVNKRDIARQLESFEEKMMKQKYRDQ